MVLGGMMVGKTDIPYLIAPFSSARAFLHVARLVVRQAMDRLRHARGTRLVMGNALAARLLTSLRRRNVPIRFETALADLVLDGGRVVGARFATAEGPRAIPRRQRRDPSLTGGIAWNAALREKLFPAPTREYDLARLRPIPAMALLPA